MVNDEVYPLFCIFVSLICFLGNKYNEINFNAGAILLRSQIIEKKHIIDPVRKYDFLEKEILLEYQLQYLAFLFVSYLCKSVNNLQPISLPSEGEN